MTTEIKEITLPKEEEFVPHPFQSIYRAGKEYENNMYKKYKAMIRALWIRPKEDADKQSYLCSDGERRVLAAMFAMEASLPRGMDGNSEEYVVHYMVNKVSTREFLDYFMLRPLLATGRCFVAGGAIMRFFFNTQKKDANQDFRDMFTENDIDVFFNDERDINTYLYFLKSKNVNVEKIEDKHHLYRVSSAIGYFTHPWLIQFTKTTETDLHRLIEDFDLPMCQVGIGKGEAIRYSIGFEVYLANCANAVIHVTKHDGAMRKDYEARLAKYEKMGFCMKRTDVRGYYGRRPWSMDYEEIHDFLFTAANQNDTLLMTLCEAYLASMNEHHKAFLLGVAQKQLACTQEFADKREKQIKDTLKKQIPTDEEAQRKTSQQLYAMGGYLDFMVRNSFDIKYVPRNTATYDLHQREEFVDSYKEKILETVKTVVEKYKGGEEINK
jgi:hypothetical protein